MDPIRMTAVVSVALIVVSIALVVSGVAVLVGSGWALVTAGCLLGCATVSGAGLLLREVGASA